jgi:transcriptional regulator with XRE-family HTH domain
MQGQELLINYNEIGARIAKRRKELKMTQDKLTNCINMSINQLSNIENSHSIPTIETILKLSHALKVTPDYFLLGISKDTTVQTLTEIGERAALCTEKQQRLICNFIDLLIKDNY